MSVPAGQSRLRAMIAAAPAVAAGDRARLLDQVSALAGDGAVLVATCHRVEVYTTDAEERQLAGLALPAGVRVLHGPAAARHAVSLAVGLESAVIAEDQLLHQLRTAVGTARREAPLDAELEMLFRLALSAGRRARSWRTGRPRSLADVALDRAEAEVGALDGRDVLVVGTGEIGRLAARAAASRGARVHVASRDPARADALAASVHGASIPFDPADRIGSMAAVVVALAGPWSLAPETVAQAARVPVVVDLSQPPALGAGFAALATVRLDDLLATTEPDPATERLRMDLERLRDTTLADFEGWRATRAGREVTGTLASVIERNRAAALEGLWRRRPDLDETARQEIERMTRHLAERLFREPFERLASDVDGRRQRAARELFGL